MDRPKLLRRKAFMDSLFELADHWTRGVSAEEYAKFLKRLFEAISVEVDAAPVRVTKGYRQAGSFRSLAKAGRAPLEIREVRPLERVAFAEVDKLVYAPNVTEARAKRDAERAAAARWRARKPRINVKMTTQPLLVSRDHFVQPLARGMQGNFGAATMTAGTSMLPMDHAGTAFRTTISPWPPSCSTAMLGQLLERRGADYKAFNIPNREATPFLGGSPRRSPRQIAGAAAAEQVFGLRLRAPTSPRQPSSVR